MTRLLRKGGIESVKSNFIPFAPTARLHQAAAAAIANNTPTILAWDSEDIDSDSLHDPAVNPSRVTITRPGRYLILAQVNYAQNATGRRSINLLRNGSTLNAQGDQFPNNATDTSHPQIIDIQDLAAGDYIEVQTTQTSGGALNGIGVIFEVTYIGPLTPNMVRDKPVVSYVTPTQFAALTPQDGDEVYLIVDATAGVTWHLRYNAGSSSAYKWEFLGGPPLEAEVDTSEGTASTGYVDLTTVGPAVTLARAGDYIVTFGGRMDSNSSVAYNYMSPKRGALATSDADGSQIYNSSPTGTWTLDAMRTRKFLGMLAGDVVKSQYRVNGGTGLWRNRYVTVQPIRIS